MFDIPDTKVFMDSIHGYISVPRCFVDHLIDTIEFQRLRNVDQTGMRILYPNAKHDRFSHSLGVFHLGCRAVDALLENFSHDDYWNINSNNKKVIFWAKNKVLFLIACLLHDIGHTPFSHSMEHIVLENSKSEDNFFTSNLVEVLNERERWGENIKSISAAPHEQIGAMYIMEHMSDAIENIFDDLIKEQYPQIESADILYAEHYNYNPVIDKDNLSQDICFIVRMILGLKYTGFEPEKQIRNCFIDLLNGGNFDVDKLDYVLRDTQMSGISNTSVDADRLLGSVSLVTKTRYTDQHYKGESFDGRVISKLSGDNKDNGLRLSGSFRGTIVLGGEARVTLETGSSFLSLSMDRSSKIKCLDEKRDITFGENTEIIQNGKQRGTISVGQKNVKILTSEQGEYFVCDIHNAKVMESSFCFETNRTAKIKLQVNGFCDINIIGRFTIESSLVCFEDTRLDGFAKEIVILGNSIKNEMPNGKVYNQFSVGFKKKAINVIANVLEARNYLYLWIYAHHKVIYYSNFLIPVILPHVIKEIAGTTERLKEELDKAKLTLNHSILQMLFYWQLNYTDIMWLDDAYLWTEMKSLYYSNKDKKTEIIRLCAELLSHKYKRSLYKSLAEYDLLFEVFTEEEKEYILDYIGRHKREDMPNILDQGEVLAGYLDVAIVDELRRKEELSNIRNIVFVRANYKAKDFNLDETFIEMNKDKIVSIGEIPLLAERVAKTRATGYYFYLYYDTDTDEIDKIHDESVRLKEAIKEYFISVCQKRSQNESC